MCFSVGVMNKQSLSKMGKRRSGRPTQRDTLRKSENLIAVATDFFVAHGFSGASIEAIARAADMGKQAVYMRFTDKESLFAAVISRLKEKPIFQELPAESGDVIGEGLPRRIRAIFEDAARPEAMVVSKLAVREGHRFPDLVQIMVEGTLARYTCPLAAYIEARKAAGDVQDIDAFDSASLCIDLIFAEITRAVYSDTPLSADAIKRAVDRIAGLMLRGVAAPGPRPKPGKRVRTP
jgi:AcrR family transcriptional regulator